MIQNNKKYLVTTDAWFVAPDGQSYRSAWGTCRVYNIKDVFNFEPLRPSTNWYLTVGDNGKEIIIAGCQLHYAVRCEDRPSDAFRDMVFTDKESGLSTTATRIYYAE